MWAKWIRTLTAYGSNYAVEQRQSCRKGSNIDTFKYSGIAVETLTTITMCNCCENWFAKLVMKSNQALRGWHHIFNHFGLTGFFSEGFCSRTTGGGTATDSGADWMGSGCSLTISRPFKDNTSSWRNGPELTAAASSSEHIIGKRTNC